MVLWMGYGVTTSMIPAALFSEVFQLERRLNVNMPSYP